MLMLRAYSLLKLWHNFA